MEKTTFSLLFYIRKTRLNKHGEAPILFRLTVNGVRADAHAHHFINPRLWNTAKGKALESGKGCKELNYYSENEEQKAATYVAAFCSSSHPGIKKGDSFESPLAFNAWLNYLAQHSPSAFTQAVESQAVESQAAESQASTTTSVASTVSPSAAFLFELPAQLTIATAAATITKEKIFFIPLNVYMLVIL